MEKRKKGKIERRGKGKSIEKKGFKKRENGKEKGKK